MPRRPLLGVLAGGLLAALAFPEPASACKKAGKKCDKDRDCCDHAKCQGKKCTCKSGFDECGGKCRDLDKDVNHCGGCNTACLLGESCVDGVCAEGGCTIDRDSCAADALCVGCPDRPGSVCYLDNGGQVRCSLVILCFDCDDDAFCEDLFGPGARCVDCAGQCSGTISGRACAAD